jgi:hypothetical protein
METIEEIKYKPSTGINVIEDKKFPYISLCVRYKLWIDKLILHDHMIQIQNESVFEECESLNRQTIRN